MSWYDFVSDIDWGGVVQRAVPAVLGTYMGQQANTATAQNIADSERQAAQIIADSNARAAALAESGAQRAEQRYAPIAARGMPALDYLGRVMGDNTLTPEQQQRILDTRRETGNLLSSRLGGRSATAVATRAAQGLENQIYDVNRARSDAAAQELSRLGVNATGALASGDINLANVLSSGERAVGTSAAGGARSAGQAVAEATSASGQQGVRMVGDIMGSPFLEALRSQNAGYLKSGNSIGVSRG